MRGIPSEKKKNVLVTWSVFGLKQSNTKKENKTWDEIGDKIRTKKKEMVLGRGEKKRRTPSGYDMND